MTTATNHASHERRDVVSDNPTDVWLAAAGDVMPPLTGPAGDAERLLLLVHYGIDWTEGWLGRLKHRGVYWDRLLPDRVIASTYRASTLRQWWCDLAGELQSAPRNARERAELERLLRGEATPVLTVLRLETEALLLRTRITADAVRAARAATSCAPNDAAASRAAAPAGGSTSPTRR